MTLLLKLGLDEWDIASRHVLITIIKPWIRKKHVYAIHMIQDGNINIVA